MTMWEHWSLFASRSYESFPNGCILQNSDTFGQVVMFTWGKLIGSCFTSLTVALLFRKRILASSKLPALLSQCGRQAEVKDDHVLVVILLIRTLPVVIWFTRWLCSRQGHLVGHPPRWSYAFRILPWNDQMILIRLTLEVLIMKPYSYMRDAVLCGTERTL